MAFVTSNLSAPLSLRVVLDEASLQSITRGIDRAIDVEARRLAVFIGKKGQQILSSLDAALGHRVIAQNWTVGEPVDKGGTVAVDVYNALENQTLQVKSNAPNSRKTYPIKGSSLISILIYGAAAHKIAARDPRNPLQFPIEKGVSASRFVGTVITKRGIEVGQFRGSGPDGTLSIGMVRHPGVTGSRILQAARLRLESAVSGQEAETARNINLTLQNGV